MIIIHSTKLLEQLTEIEERIKAWERLMEDKGVELDREKLLTLLVRAVERKN
jgi:ketopantoate reductase